MQKWTNKFSWSKSRNDIFNECARKYYFHYYGSWGGWENNAPDLTRQLYILKQLKTRHMWAGEIVHNCLQQNLDNLRKGIKPLPLEQVIDQTLKFMRNDFRNSMNNNYWHSPKSCALFEHEYRVPVSKEEWQKLADQIKLAITNFFNSKTYQTILTLPLHDIKEIEQFSYFQLDEIKIIVKLDFCFYLDGHLYIYDWKTGKNNDKNDLQLACYALYATKQWQIPLTHCKLLEYNLAKDKLNHFFISSNILEETYTYIQESVKKMQHLLYDKKHNLAREDDFPKTNQLFKCKNCNFMRICQSSG